MVDINEAVTVVTPLLICSTDYLSTGMDLRSMLLDSTVVWVVYRVRLYRSHRLRPSAGEKFLAVHSWSLSQPRNSDRPKTQSCD